MNVSSQFRSQKLGSNFFPPVLFGCLLLSLPVCADQFGDISVSPNAMFTGSTYHGYAEMRVVLENTSSKSHVVTLVYPNRSGANYGNHITRLSRSVELAPETRLVVPLLQPPLPAQGDGSIRVEVDGRHEGEVRAPNANNHCNYYSGYPGSGNQVATILVSRSLDFDPMARVFQTAGAAAGAFTAAKATGPADAGTSGGVNPNCWMPDTSIYGRTNWLELDYAAPEPVNKVVIHSTQPLPKTGTITLLSTSGTNIAQASMSAGSPFSSGWEWQTEFSFPAGGAPVKTIRLDFGKAPPHTIAIDAVQISGPSGAPWAADARASSDNSAYAARYRPAGVNPDDAQSLRAESPVTEWSETWLGYSPFDAVAVNGADIAAMTPAVFAAVGDYIQAGGNLVVLGKAELPAAWHSATKTRLENGAVYDIGFGRVFAFDAENPSALGTQAVQQLRTAVRDNARYFQTLPTGSGAANSIIPVVENIKIPTRGIVIVMLAFVIIIGPVNIIYLNRIKRRTWMLWTIPAISLATTLLVFTYSLLREGITPDTRICGLTVLDQASHRAATVGGEAFYCPLTPSGGLHFELDTEATPLVSVDYGSGNGRELDWSQAQHFQRGWVSARVPAHFHLRKSETRRERIQIVSEGGRMQVVNSLGAGIKSIWYADSNLNIYEAANVPAGEKGPLILSKQISSREKAAGAAGLWRDLGFSARSEGLDASAGRYLLPNTYIAVLDANPFLENALGTASSPKRTRSSAVVFGVLDADEKMVEK